MTLGVFATGTSPLSYQWRKDGRDLPGETNPALTIANVTGAAAGNYSVLVTNKLGSVASSDATLSVLHVREEPIAEVNFQDKQPSAGYSAFAYSGNRVTLTANITEMAGAGVGGAAGLVMTADGSGLKANMNQPYAGFVAKVAVLANSADGVNTTNLNLYKLYATVRTTGCLGAASHGKVQWQFLTPDGAILTVDLAATFTSDYQVYSFVLGDGAINRYAGGSWDEFIASFAKIDRVQCAVQVNNWLSEYGADADNKIYVSDVKFVRLVPTSSTPPPGVTDKTATADSGKVTN